MHAPSEVQEFFLHCPRCGIPSREAPTRQSFQCRSCSFQYYFGSALAAAVFVRRDDGHALFVRRARDPGKGKLAPPGGFIDPGESAETAAHRELREEVGIEVTDLTFLCSHPNRYFYADISYPVLDLFFVARAGVSVCARALDDVTSVSWLDPLAVDPAELAFPSMTAALATWQKRLRRHRSGTDSSS